MSSGWAGEAVLWGWLSDRVTSSGHNLLSWRPAVFCIIFGVGLQEIFDSARSGEDLLSK